MTTGDKIKFFRKDKGITQSHVSYKSGIHPVTLRKYESNKTEPQPAQLEKIAQVLGVNVHALKENESVPSVPMNILYSETESIGLLIHFLKQGIMQMTGDRNPDGTLIAKTVSFSFSNWFSTLFIRPDAAYLSRSPLRAAQKQEQNIENSCSLDKEYKLYDEDLLEYILQWDHAMYLCKVAHEQYLASDEREDWIKFKEAKEYQDLTELECNLVSNYQ